MSKKRNKGAVRAANPVQDKAIEQGQRRQTNDSFINPFDRLGFGRNNLLSTNEYPITRLTQNYALLNSLYRNDWIAKKIIDSVAEDMTKNWFALQGTLEPQLISAYEKIERKTHVKKAILDGLRWGRLFGGAAGVMVIDGQEDMLEEPLDMRMVVPDSFKGIIIADRWNGVYPSTELVQDLADPDFGLPEYYNFNMADTALDVGSICVHHSRVLRFTGRELPLIERMAETYWGASELEHVFTELNKRNTTSENVANLIFQANVRTYKMSDLGQLLATTNGDLQRQLYQTLQMQNFLMSNMGMNVMDKEDDFQTNQYTFGGLSEIYDAFMNDIAGAAEIPATRLFGRSPAGMNATGESDLSNYYDKVAQLQEAKLRPILEKLLPVLFMSALGAVPDDWDVEFNPVAETSEEEKANLVKQSADAIISVFQSGLISQQTALKELRQSGMAYGMWSNITDEDIENADTETNPEGEMGEDEMGGMMPEEGAEQPEDESNAPDGLQNDITNDAFQLDYPGQPRNHGRFGKGKQSGEEQSSKGKGASGEPSATGANKFQRGFTPSKAARHEKHRQAQYPHLTQKQYEQRGVELCEQPVGGDIDGFIDNAGNVVRYRKSTNELAVGHPQRGLFSLFKPKNSSEAGYEYFLRQKASAERSARRGKKR